MMDAQTIEVTEYRYLSAVTELDGYRVEEYSAHVAEMLVMYFSTEED